MDRLIVERARDCMHGRDSRPNPYSYALSYSCPSRTQVVATFRIPLMSPGNRKGGITIYPVTMAHFNQRLVTLQLEKLSETHSLVREGLVRDQVHVLLLSSG